MENTNYVIHLVGRSCSGKSTVAGFISDALPGIFTVDYDHLKWQLAGYHRDQHARVIEELGESLYEKACSMSLPVLLKLFTHNQEKYDLFKKIAEKTNHKYIPIFLTAPDDVLLDRFRKRINNAKTTGQKISMTDENIFKSWLAIPYFTPKEAVVFDTSKEAPRNIAAEIVKLI